MGKLDESINVLLDCGSVTLEVTAGTLLATTGVGVAGTVVLYAKAAVDSAQCGNSAMRLWNEFQDPTRNKKLDDNIYYSYGTYFVNVLSIGKLGKAAITRLASPVSTARVMEVNRLLHENDFLKRILSKGDAFEDLSQISRGNSKKLKRLVAENLNKSPLSNNSYKAMVWATHTGKGSPFRLAESDLSGLNSLASDARKEFFDIFKDGFDFVSGTKTTMDDEFWKGTEKKVDKLWLILEPTKTPR